VIQFFSRPYFSIAAVLIFMGTAHAQFKVPTLTGPVVDNVSLLSRGMARNLESQLRDFERTTGGQVQLLIVPSLEGEDIAQVAIKVFDEWKIGQKKIDNGVLFLIAPNERKLRIEVGRGYEGVLPDIYAKRIISDVVVPYFKSGQFDQGVEAGVDHILGYLKQERIGEPRAKSSMSRQKKIDILIFILFIIFSLIFGHFGGGGRPGRRRSSFDGFGGFGGGGFGGGGGWSGGGGGSSGGGSSGSW